MRKRRSGVLSMFPTAYLSVLPKPLLDSFLPRLLILSILGKQVLTFCSVTHVVGSKSSSASHKLS